MRRLIDVDELIKYFGEDLEGYDNREYILQMLDVKGRIERVEAIPKEWIKKYNRVRGWEVTVTTQNAIDNMLNAWDEEQARLFEKQITEECTSAERFEEWEKENESRSTESNQ